MLTGVIHMQAMPGDVAYRSGGFDGVMQAAMRDFDALVTGGVDAIIVENFGSAPFDKGTRGHRIPSHHVAFMARLASALVQAWPQGRIGINCLRNDARAALGVAAACGAHFVRINVHTGAYVTDQGLIEGDAADTLRYRRQLDADDVAIWADVLVKHATPLAPLDPVTATHDCVRRGKADAIIVTGSGTGEPVDAKLLATVSQAAEQAPVYLGSGVTPERLDAFLPHASGAIVGTWLKHDGVLHNPVDPARVTELVNLCKGRWA